MALAAIFRIQAGVLIRLNGAVAFALAAPVADATSSVTLAWDASSEPDVAGYKLYSGTNSRTYTLVIDAGNRTS